MSYQVLARKWRPRNFDEMVGQEQARQALRNALDSDRLHHAYLFTGTRGVGKTTIARVIAKCLNCETGVTSTPCGECGACVEIDEGRFLDLIEVDAASRTGVDDTRELLENVRFSPAKGRFKVYLIDEVHMFSKHSFNALLKTLEEPPPYVKFLLATTDPQKIPPTILSRCLQFHLRPLSAGKIGAQIERILAAEGIESESVAVREIARAARGSMRDALSILDQAIAFGGGKLAGDEVRTMLGLVGRDQVAGIIQALARQDGPGLLERVRELADQSADFPTILEELLAQLHRLAVLKAVPEAGVGEEDTISELRELAEQLSEEDIQLYYQIGLIGRRDMPFATDPRSGMEMTLLRMLAFRPLEPTDAGADHGAMPRNGAAPARPPAGTPQPQAQSADRITLPKEPTEPGMVDEPQSPPVVSRAPIPAGEGRLSLPWEDVVPHLHVSGLSRELLHNAALESRSGNHFRLVVDETKKALLGKGAEERIMAAMGEWFGQPVRVEFTVTNHRHSTPADRIRKQEEQQQRDAVAALREDPLVREMQRLFDAELDEQSVKPIRSAEDEGRVESGYEAGPADAGEIAESPG